MADCATMLQALLHNAEVTARMLQEHDVIAACVQAAETEHAARIATVATRQAANWGLLTGFSALGAAGIAYMAARMQTRVEEDQNRARRIAYQRHFRSLLGISKVELAGLLIRLLETDQSIIGKIINKNIPFLIKLREEISTKNWDRHALLGEHVANQLAYTSTFIELGFGSIELLTRANTLSISSIMSSAHDTLSELQLQLTNLATALDTPISKPKGAIIKNWVLSRLPSRP